MINSWAGLIHNRSIKTLCACARTRAVVNVDGGWYSAHLLRHPAFGHSSPGQLFGRPAALGEVAVAL